MRLLATDGCHQPLNHSALVLFILLWFVAWIVGFEMYVCVAANPKAICITRCSCSNVTGAGGGSVRETTGLKFYSVIPSEFQIVAISVPPLLPGCWWGKSKWQPTKLWKEKQL
jgi:hypothetical protein